MLDVFRIHPLSQIVCCRKHTFWHTPSFYQERVSACWSGPKLSHVENTRYCSLLFLFLSLAVCLPARPPVASQLPMQLSARLPDFPT